MKAESDPGARPRAPRAPATEGASCRTFDGDETPFESLGEEDELRLLRAFAEWDVRAIVIGGYAVRVHGYLRAAGDLDLVIDPASENLERMERALVTLGVPNAAAVRELFCRPTPAKWSWRAGYLDHYVDLVSAASTFTFRDLDGSAITAMHEGLSLRVMSFESLVGAKRASSEDSKRDESKREQDRDDLREILGI